MKKSIGPSTMSVLPVYSIPAHNNTRGEEVPLRPFIQDHQKDISPHLPIWIQKTSLYSALKLTMIYLILISGLSNTRLLLFLNHFRESSTIPYFKGAFIWIGKEREFHQCIKEREILILRVIIDQFLSLGILLDLLNPWYALKLFTTWKVMTSYPMTNLRISNDTLLKLVYTEWSMIGLKTLMRVNWRVHAYWIYLSVLIPLIMTSF